MEESTNEKISANGIKTILSDHMDTPSSSASGNNVVSREEGPDDLPKNRFELELEFVQALASPAYIHFLATSRSEIEPSLLLLQDPSFQSFLVYLRDTWSRPEYSRFIIFPHSLYFLNLLIDNPVVMAKEWTLPAYRNFCHQQQFLAWQHRHSTCYGIGGAITLPEGLVALSNSDKVNPTATDTQIANKKEQ